MFWRIEKSYFEEPHGERNSKSEIKHTLLMINPRNWVEKLEGLIFFFGVLLVFNGVMVEERIWEREREREREKEREREF